LGIAGSDGVSVVFAAASAHPASLAGSIDAITLPFSVHVSFAGEAQYQPQQREQQQQYESCIVDISAHSGTKMAM